MPGARLGAYEIVSLLGAGGMGEVYRARDTRLDRTVAIKVLPPETASTPELRERFEREARTVAALNHPHICTLHDVGREDEVQFLVMEYLEGETLQDRLERGPLPLDQASHVAIQVADALAAAHRAGVVHRDLKPGNIMLLRRGTGAPDAKLLDFGLAKPTSPVAAGAASMLPTTPRGLTVEGTILGTFQYMAPEQLEGQEADARTDIFAFGSVLYEMLTGRRAFVGKSHAGLIAAILEHEPAPLSTVEPSVPRRIEHVVRRCLAKHPDERWQTATDLHRELQWAAESPAPEQPPSGRQPAAGVAVWRRPVPLGAATGAALVVAALAGAGTWMLPRAATSTGSRVARVSLVLPPGDEAADPQGTAVAVSPDGSRVAYVASSGGREQLFLRDITAHDARPLGGTDGARSPFFSPDGQWVGFFAQGMVKKVSVAAGTVQTLAEAPNGVGGGWSEDGTIYFGATNVAGLSSVSADGGAARQVTQLDRAAGEVSHRWPHVLPGGRALLLAVWTGPAPDESRVDVLRLDTGERTVVVRGGTGGKYTPTGHVVYARGEELFAVPFESARLQVRGQSVRLRDTPRYLAEGPQFAVSASGALAYVMGGPQRDERRLVWVSRDGRLDPLPVPVRAYVNVALAPDGRRAAVDVTAGTVEIWVYDVARGTFTRLTTGDGSSQAPRWTSDGVRITYRATRAGFRNVWWKAVDDATAEERLTTSDNAQTASSWSPDGRWLVYHESDSRTASDIWALPSNGDRTPRVVVRSAGSDWSPRLSPDGRWLAYASNESGRYDVFVQPFPGPGNRVQVSIDGGIEPVWSRDGRELFYLNGNRMMAAAIRTTPTFVADAPRPLFTGRFTPSPNGVAGYDVGPDGRFLMVQPLHPEPPTNQIQVVLNWFDELRRLRN